MDKQLTPEEIELAISLAKKQPNKHDYTDPYFAYQSGFVDGFEKRTAALQARVKEVEDNNNWQYDRIRDLEKELHHEKGLTRSYYQSMKDGESRIAELEKELRTKDQVLEAYYTTDVAKASRITKLEQDLKLAETSEEVMGEYLDKANSRIAELERENAAKSLDLANLSADKMLLTLDKYKLMGLLEEAITEPHALRPAHAQYERWQSYCKEHGLTPNKP